MSMDTDVFIFGIGSGIGKSLFQRFLKEPNTNVFGFSRKGEEKLHEFQSKKSYVLDLTKEDQLEELNHFFQIHLKKRFQTVQKLVVYFAHGDGVFGPVEKAETKSIHSHFQLNVYSLFALCKIFHQALPTYHSTNFVFMGSTAGRIGFPESTLYCASKHAVTGFAKSLREEWKTWGAKVVQVHLGAVATEIWDSRPEFDKNDMVSVDDCAEYLLGISHLPDSVFLDEVAITPRKGIL
ncbi:SDR family NAD(P)-dependent oxidoreductase [Leptospira sp. 96542]|nr:SDR family NAD(P)-dependent oxidoreductase [Leptospira sp. 96542]